LGYQSALTYKNQTEFYRDAEFNLWAKPNETNRNDLIPFELQKEIMELITLSSLIWEVLL
jgi:hypothetical protein